MENEKKGIKPEIPYWLLSVVGRDSEGIKPEIPILVLSVEEMNQLSSVIITTEEGVVTCEIHTLDPTGVRLSDLY